jgi:glycosyltransferase involved in cell wall biosynthesis
MMKIALTTGSLSRDAGGLFESVRAMGKGLSELGVGVSVYGLRDQNWGRDEKAWDPLRARAFSFIGPRALAWSPEMDAALDEECPDVVALQGLWQYSSIATRRQWRRRGVPYVISPRGMLDKWALANSRWKKALAAWAFENAVLRDAACLHALCESEADAMRAYGLRQRIEVVPNGVVLPAEPAGDSRSKIGDRVGRRRLVFLGRIHPKKGLVGLIRAWAALRNSPSAIRDFAEWELVIAGWDQGGHEGELKGLCGELGLKIADSGGLMAEGKAENLKAETLKTLDSGRSTLDASSALDSRRWSLDSADVIFWGPAFGEEKEVLLRSAEAFVLPSFSEGLPMSVLEAWAYGLPVVMTPECNLPEGFASGAALEIRNSSTSQQATSHSPLATPTKWASDWDGLRELIEMPEAQRCAIGMRGRRLVEDKFTWPKVAARMKEIYESLL